MSPQSPLCPPRPSASFGVVLAALGALVGSPSHADVAELGARSDAQTMRVIYNGYFGAFRIMKVSLDTAVTPDAYAAAAVFRSAGIAGFFKETEIHASVDGARAADELSPEVYLHHNLKSKKDRRIRIDFPDGIAASTVTPPFGTMGDPPASDADRTGALDPITGFLGMMFTATRTPCERTAPMFDGKQRYDLRMERVGVKQIDVRGFEGEAIECNAYYTPIAGYDPEDLADPETYAKPFTLWFAQVADDLYVPVRIQARTNGVSVRVDAKSVRRN